MTDKTILKFGAVDNAETGDLAGWVVVEGKPTMKTAVQHTTADGKVMSGTWQATPGTYHATYSDYEFVHMIAELADRHHARRAAQPRRSRPRRCLRWLDSAISRTRGNDHRAGMIQAISSSAVDSFLAAVTRSRLGRQTPILAASPEFR